jgi:hypothetical protein
MLVDVVICVSMDVAFLFLQNEDWKRMITRTLVLCGISEDLNTCKHVTPCSHKDDVAECNTYQMYFSLLHWSLLNKRLISSISTTSFIKPTHNLYLSSISHLHNLLTIPSVENNGNIRLIYNAATGS